MTHVQKIQAALEAGDQLTAMDALRRFGCFSLAVVVFKLKKRGLPVQSEMIELPNGKHVARYSLPRNQKKPDIRATA